MKKHISLIAEAKMKISLYSCFKKIAFIFATFFILIPSSYAASPIIMGYWENWGTYHGFSMPGSTRANEIMRGQLTGLNALTYSFLEVNSVGNVYFTDAWSDLTSLNANDVAFCEKIPDACPNFDKTRGGIGSFDAFLKLPVEHKIIALGGGTHDDTFENAFKHSDQFIQSLKLLLSNFPGITGIDLDYEPAGGIPCQNISAFISLIERIKKDIPQLKISYTLIANHHGIQALGRDNWKKLAGLLDYVGVMGYDFHGAFDKANPMTALHSSLYSEGEDDFSDEKAIRTLIEMGVPNNKILLGMPAYGRAVGGVSQAGLNQTFTRSFQGDLDDEKCSTDLNAGWSMCTGSVSYRDLIFNYPKSTPVYMNKKLSGVYSYSSDHQVFVSYDNKDSVLEKAHFAQENKLAGVFFWSLRSDVKVTHPESLITAVAGAYGIKTYQPSPIAKPKLYSYYAGWYPPQGAAPIPNFKMDGLLIAFATIQKNGNTYSTTFSGDFNIPSGDPLKSYTVWNNWVRQFGGKAYVSFGGGTNEALRKYIIEGNPEDLAALANEVQHGVGQMFDGVDLDIEGWWNYGKEDNLKFARNLAQFVKLLRTDLDADPWAREKPIMLAVGYEAAGEVTGLESNPAYAGSMKPFFADNKAMSAVTSILIMSYNINVDHLYGRHDLVNNILNTFSNAGIADEKIFFGIQPYQKINGPATPLATVQSLSEFIKNSGYGGVFMWGIGTQGLGNLSGYDYLAAMKAGLGI